MNQLSKRSQTCPILSYHLSSFTQIIIIISKFVIVFTPIDIKTVHKIWCAAQTKFSNLVFLGLLGGFLVPLIHKYSSWEALTDSFRTTTLRGLLLNKLSSLDCSYCCQQNIFVVIQTIFVAYKMLFIHISTYFDQWLLYNGYSDIPIIICINIFWPITKILN